MEAPARGRGGRGGRGGGRGGRSRGGDRGRGSRGRGGGAPRHPEEAEGHDEGHEAAPAAVAAAPATITAAAPAAQRLAASEPPPRARQSKPDTELVHQAPRPPSSFPRIGRLVGLLTNVFPFAFKGDKSFLYSTEFQPPHDDTQLKRRLLEQHKAVLGPFVFDGHMVYCAQKLSQERFMSTEGSDEYRITLHFSGERSHVKEATSGQMQLYNVVLRKILRALQYKQIGRQYFDPSRPVSIPEHRLELWPGIFTSVLYLEGGPMLMVDVAHKVIRQESVLDFIDQMYESMRGKRNEEIQAAIAGELIGQIVITRYNNRTYRIDDVDWAATPRSTFTLRTGETVSYQQYYAETYKRSLRNVNQPLLVNRQHRGGREAAIYLIPELCSMTGFTDAMRADYFVMRDITDHSRVLPPQRAETISGFGSALGANAAAKQELNSWNISVSNSMLAISGRVLPPETLVLAGRRVTIDQNQPEWTRQTRDLLIPEAVALENWLLLYTPINARHANELVKSFGAVAGPIGIKVAEPLAVELPDDRTHQQWPAAIKQHFKPGVTQCVVCILPNNRKDRYDTIKKACLLTLPVPSQCVVARSLDKKGATLSVAHKVIQQINCKLGGQLWQLEIPLQHAMLIGIDVCHDTASRKAKASVAGFCATLNPEFTKYYSRVTFQSAGQELVDGLKMCLTDALKAYATRNGSLPAYIVVYRDGVGDGMLQSVIDREVPQFQETFTAIEGRYQPRLIYVIVKKRIHNRLFSRDPKTAELGNPQPGTVVDTVVTHKGWYDFFLVSQSVRQGTVTPTHYHVIKDTTGLTPDQVQVLTNKMCHLYYNWAGPIRVPAPCQYAHKIAFLVGQNVHKDPAVTLRDKLYFL